MSIGDPKDVDMMENLFGRPHYGHRQTSKKFDYISKNCSTCSAYVGKNGINCYLPDCIAIQKRKDAYKAKIKKICYSCKTFDRTQRKSYKCAVKGSCPGLDKLHGRLP